MTMTDTETAQTGEIMPPSTPPVAPSPGGDDVPSPSVTPVAAGALVTGALAAAWGQYKPVKMSGKNPHFQSRYATLTDGFDAIREALSSNGLVVTHQQELEGGTLWSICTLRHKSGETLSDRWPICEWPIKATQQQLASANTYARRYSMFNLLGISGDPDDDGNAGNEVTTAGEDPVIDLDQITYLQQQIRDVSDDKAAPGRFLRRVKAASFETMRVSQYKMGLELLNNARKEREKEAAGA